MGHRTAKGAAAAVTGLLHLRVTPIGSRFCRAAVLQIAIMRMVLLRIAILICVMPAIARGHDEAPGAPAIFGGRSLVDAHNAYPEGGKWRDRIGRALALDQVPVVIEQDIAFAPRNEAHLQSVVSHEPTVSGSEPTLEEHFFDRVRPIIERALAANQKDRAVLVLHLDFKTNEREHHRAVGIAAPAPGVAGHRRADVDPMTIGTPSPTAAGADRKRRRPEKDFRWAAASGSFLLFDRFQGLR